MRSPWMALADGLAELETQLSRLDDASFSRAGEGRAGSAGEAVRRSLAQLDALESGLRARDVSDDARATAAWVEGDRGAALVAVRQAIWRALSLHGVALGAPVEVETRFAHDAQPFVVPSSAGRELALLVGRVRDAAALLRECHVDARQGGPRHVRAAEGRRAVAGPRELVS